MVRRPLSALPLQFALAFAKAGVLPIVAVLVLAGATILHFVAVPQAEARRNASQRALAALRSAPAEGSPSRDLAGRYADIRAQLASSEDRGDLLKALFKIAAEAGVTLAQADYRLQPDPDCSCQQLQITLPVRGTYPQARAFIDAALAGVASLSLDELSLRRENVKNPSVEARLKLTLFLRGED